MTTAIVHSGRAQRTDQLELVDVAAGAGEQVAGAGGLDRADRQRQRVADEVLAQPGQHLLAERLAEVPRVPGEHGLQDEEAGEVHDDAVDVGRGRALVDRLHEATEQPGRGQCGERGQQVQGQRTPQHPRVGAGHALERTGAGSRESATGSAVVRAHALASTGTVSRVTRARKSGRESSSSR